MNKSLEANPQRVKAINIMAKIAIDTCSVVLVPTIGPAAVVELSKTSKEILDRILPVVRANTK